MAHIPGMIRAMAAVPRVHLADPQANAQEILALLRQADEQRAELCVFPELCLCGYTCADLLLHPPLLAGCLQALETLLRAPVRAAFVVGLPLEIGGRLYNCAAAVCGGRMYLVEICLACSRSARSSRTAQAAVCAASPD